MRLVWSAEGSGEDPWAVLRARGFEPHLWGLLRSGRRPLIKHRFPLLIGADGSLVREAVSFLYDIAYVRGSTRSLRTLETYAESLNSWLSYAEEHQLGWRHPTAPMLASYRDQMLGTDGTRDPPLSRRTVNLRLSVALEFYKHLGCKDEGEEMTVTQRNEARTASPPSVKWTASRSSSLATLRVRVYRRRPRALRAEDCQNLSGELKAAYRLMWQWALCTGLRTSSLLRLRLGAFESLASSVMSDPMLSVLAKGGKIVSVHVPQALRDATERYIEVDRRLAASRPACPAKDAALFLNRTGRPVTAKAYYRAFRRAAARLRIHAFPHQARTTFATFVRDRLERLNAAGHHLDAVKIVQSLLAHADAATTEAYLDSIDVPSLDVLRLLDELAARST
jgi:integrase